MSFVCRFFSKQANRRHLGLFHLRNEIVVVGKQFSVLASRTGRAFLMDGTRPFFVNAPLKDHDFEVSGVRDVYRSAHPIYKLLGKPGNLLMLHPDCGHDFPAEIRETAYGFVEKHLKK